MGSNKYRALIIDANKFSMFKIVVWSIIKDEENLTEDSVANIMF